MKNSSPEKRPFRGEQLKKFDTKELGNKSQRGWGSLLIYRKHFSCTEEKIKAMVSFNYELTKHVRCFRKIQENLVLNQAKTTETVKEIQTNFETLD